MNAHFSHDSVFLLACGSAGCDLMDLFKGCAIEREDVERLFEMIESDMNRASNHHFEVAGVQPRHVPDWQMQAAGPETNE
jgi:hypothetical protein